jgi:hypothetical protein
MIYEVQSAAFRSFLASGKRTPTTDEVCDALTAIKSQYPHLEATEVNTTTGEASLPVHSCVDAASTYLLLCESTCRVPCDLVCPELATACYCHPFLSFYISLFSDGRPLNTEAP